MSAKDVHPFMQENILIIDCCNTTRQAYESILLQQYALLFAETAQKGLSLISNNVRLTFLDMALPDASGLEVLLAINYVCPVAIFNQSLTRDIGVFLTVRVPADRGIKSFSLFSLFLVRELRVVQWGSGRRDWQNDKQG